MSRNLLRKLIREMIDAYGTLGLERGAEHSEIYTTYRKLAKQYHPDRNGDDEALQKMKDINVAKDILLDPEKRIKYDKTLDAQSHPGYDWNDSSTWKDVDQSFRGDKYGQIHWQDVEDYDGNVANGSWLSLAGYEKSSMDGWWIVSSVNDDDTVTAKKQAGSRIAIFPTEALYTIDSDGPKTTYKIDPEVIEQKSFTPRKGNRPGQVIFGLKANASKIWSLSKRNNH